jgi:hypothetical protein
MKTPRTQAGRLIRVRLTDVPLKIRQSRGKALYDAAVADRDLLLATEINAAIEHPSDEYHWLREAAVRKVLK